MFRGRADERTVRPPAFVSIGEVDVERGEARRGETMGWSELQCDAVRCPFKLPQKQAGSV